jgi:hypothetical protein
MQMLFFVFLRRSAKMIGETEINNQRIARDRHRLEQLRRVEIYLAPETVRLLLNCAKNTPAARRIRENRM